jgi:hypothetical protein
MRWAAQAAVAGLFVAGFSADAFSATAPDSTAPAKESVKPEAASPSLDSIIGKKLVSIDGSLITLSASEGVLAREIVSANGAIQKSNFRFINDRLGTVSDARDNAKVVGVFRTGQSDINIQYADGTIETLLATTSGGISLETKASAGAAYCTTWYPEGHVFSMDERKAALAQYASRLGLGDNGDKAPASHGCNTAAPTPPADTSAKKIDPPKADAAKPAVLASAAGAGAAAAAAVKAAPKVADVAATAVAPKLADAAATAVAAKTTDVAASAAAKAIEVRTSEVHAIDAVAATGEKPDAKTDAPAPQKLASLEQPAAETPKGASGCLSVESDGSHWGFKNKCGYTVQFAYCLMGTSALASCKDGAVVGSVAGSGFGALVTDESLKETDVAHDFRWVACQGGAGEVIPHLDETNPPSGRCVR